MRGLVILITIIFGSFTSWAQISEQFHGWYMYFGNHRLTENWGLHTEFQWRRADGISQWQQSLMRIAVDYRPMDHVMFTLGYGHIETYPYGDQPVAHRFTEHRIWQQALTDNDVWRLNLRHRFRLEQRWLQQWAKSGNDLWGENGWEYRNRLRYQVYVSLPINRRKMEDRTVFIGLYDELFIQFGDAVRMNVFDQNRAYAALGYRHSARWNVQLGYLNQWLIKPDGSHKENNHTIQVALTYNLDLRKLLKSNPAAISN